MPLFHNVSRGQVAILSCKKSMTKSLIFVYVVAAILFSYQQSQYPNFSLWRKAPKCPWLYKNEEKKDQIEIIKKSFLCGDKRGLNRKTRRAYKNLNLYHLFTPSGIHLGIFYLINRPLINLTSRLSPTLSLIYKFILSVWPWFINGFFSLKRIGGMHLIKLLPINLSPKQIFFVFFTFDFFLGTYSMSPMSWTFSFLFLGIVFHTYQKSFLQFSLYLFSGQLLAAVFSYQEVYPLSFLPSFVLTAFFTPIFILSFTNNTLQFLGIELLDKVTNFSIENFNAIVLLTNNILINTFSLKPEIFTLLFTFGLLIKNKRLIFIALFLTAPRIYNLPDSRARQSAYVFQNDFSFRNEIKKTKMDKRGLIKLEFKNNRSCSLKLMNYGKTKHCRFKKIN